MDREAVPCIHEAVANTIMEMREDGLTLVPFSRLMP